MTESPSDSDGEWWEYDPEHDAPGSLLHAVHLLDHFRARGGKFHAYGVNLDVAAPVATPKLFTDDDLAELDECQPLIIELLRLEAYGLYNLQRTAGVPEESLEDLSLPDEP